RTQHCWGFNGYERGYNQTDQYGVYRYGFVFYIYGRYSRAFNRLHHYDGCRFFCRFEFAILV
ncbi:hypothetical protein TRIATDRAFT_300300, partial [Trichoderma atroviride IMI 206040]